MTTLDRLELQRVPLFSPESWTYSFKLHVRDYGRAADVGRAVETDREELLGMSVVPLQLTAGVPDIVTRITRGFAKDLSGSLVDLCEFHRDPF